MTSVNVERVTAGYGGPPVLRDLSLDVGSAEILAILGASGSGKTTLLRALTGFLRPASGTVRFGDRVVSGPDTWVPPEHRRVGIVPQEGALFPHLDVAGNVAFGLPRGSTARVEEMLDLVGMGGMGGHRPQELSGGQQQRVALARALAPEPDVLCLDEPFSALDASLRGRLRAEVREVLAATGTTAILVTHDQEEALSIADRVAVVRDGEVVQVASPDDLYGRPADLATARFVGELVELDATVVAAGIAATALGEVSVQVEVGTVGRRGTVVLRPEQLSVTVVPDDAASAPGTPGTVRARSYHGHDAVLVVTMGDGTEVKVRTTDARGTLPGDRVHILRRGPGYFFTAP